VISVRALVATRLHVFGVYGSAFAIIARHARIIVPFVVVAASIPAALELLVEHELDRGLAALLTSVVDNFATAIFAGAVEQLVHRWEDGERRIPLRGVLSRVPPVILPLFVVAIAQGLVVALGFVLLIVPGLLALTYFSLVGPIVVAERLGIRATFRRSAHLVRGNFWRVFAVMFSLELLAGLIAFVVGVIFSSIGESSENPIALAIGEAVTLPLEVMAVAVMYWRLRGIEALRARAPDDALADAPPAN
jgi:uncharacterized membrane protein